MGDSPTNCTYRCPLLLYLIGEIRSPGWDGKSLYPPGVDKEIRLTVPPQHVTMLTFLALNMSEVKSGKKACYLQFDRIFITTRGLSSGNLTLIICGSDPPKEKLYTADVISVRFVTNWSDMRATGFRLLYSFHSRGETPEQLPNGTWNCSVQSWASVQDHFPCNLLTECAGGEDEADCPYSSPLCAQGEFFMGHSCYTYLRVGEISWKVASAQCQMKGSQLVSLNDMSEWRGVIQILRQYGVLQAYTGLRSTSPALPMM